MAHGERIKKEKWSKSSAIAIYYIDILINTRRIHLIEKSVENHKKPQKRKKSKQKARLKLKITSITIIVILRGIDLQQII